MELLNEHKALRCSTTRIPKPVCLHYGPNVTELDINWAGWRKDSYCKRTFWINSPIHVYSTLFKLVVRDFSMQRPVLLLHWRAHLGGVQIHNVLAEEAAEDQELSHGILAVEGLPNSVEEGHSIFAGISA